MIYIGLDLFALFSISNYRHTWTNCRSQLHCSREASASSLASGHCGIGFKGLTLASHLFPLITENGGDHSVVKEQIIFYGVLRSSLPTNSKVMLPKAFPPLVTGHFRLLPLGS